MNRQQLSETLHCRLQLGSGLVWPWQQCAEDCAQPLKVIRRVHRKQQRCHTHEHAEEQQNAQESSVDLQIESAHHMFCSSSWCLANT